MALTDAQLLDQVETAITAILEGAQEYEVEGRRYRRAELKTLQDMRARLQSTAATETTGSVRTLARFAPR